MQKRHDGDFHASADGREPRHNTCKKP